MQLCISLVSFRFRLFQNNSGFSSMLVSLQSASERNNTELTSSRMELPSFFPNGSVISFTITGLLSSPNSELYSGALL